MRTRAFVRWWLPVVAAGLFAGQLAAQAPDLHAVAGRPDVWPRDVLSKAAISPAKGAALIAAGSAMKVIGLEGPLVDLDYQGTLLVVPVAQTDFLERAAINLRSRPEPPVPRVPPQPPAAAVPAVGPVKSANVLGATIAPGLLVFDPKAKVDHLVSGGEDAVSHPYILLQFGGGRRWPDAMKDLAPALQAAREHGSDLGTVLVPVRGSSVASSIALYRECGFNGPMIDARKTALVDELWKEYGNDGTFALALVNANGQIISKTIATPKGVDRFHSVTAALANLPARQ